MPRAGKPSGLDRDSIRTKSLGRMNAKVMILLLTLAGAGVDAMVILGFNVLTAAQTGNTILMSVAIARGDFVTGLSAAVSVAAFVAGAAVGELLVLRRAGAGNPAAGALLAEILLLAALYPLWRLAGASPGQTFTLVLVGLAAVAMGIQSAAVRSVSSGPTTTYITGVLTSFTTGIVKCWRTTPAPAGAAAPSAESPWSFGLVWAVYVTGAIGCGFLYLHVGFQALLVPLGAVVAGVAASFRRR